MMNKIFTYQKKKQIILGITFLEFLYIIVSDFFFMWDRSFWDLIKDK